MLEKFGNYKVFLFSNSILSFATGLFTPFWIIFIQNFGGGIEQFGFSIGLMVLAQSVTSYYSGKFSDKLGRKNFLLGSGFALVVVVYLYTLITSLPQLYILQILNGVAGAVNQTITTVFLGDITRKQTRGLDVGKFHAIAGVASAIAMMAGGFVVGQLGFKIIFYITAAIIFVSTLMLVYLKEK